MRKPAKAALGNTKVTPDRRDHHGFRGTPAPACFDLYQLPDGALLTELEVAALLRLSSNTLGAWRQRQGDRHPLRWLVLPNGFVRYRVSDIRGYLASGQPRKRGQPRKKDAAPAPQQTKTAECPQDAAPPDRRARTRAAATGAPPPPSEDDDGIPDFLRRPAT